MRIAIADDSALFREGLELQLRRSGQQVVAVARAGDELLALTDRHRIDAAILDVRMPPTFTDEGLRTAEQLAERHPEVGILLLSAYAETAYAERLFADGTERRGYLLKDQVDNAAALCDASSESATASPWSTTLSSNGCCAGKKAAMSWPS